MNKNNNKHKSKKFEIIKDVIFPKRYTHLNLILVRFSPIDSQEAT